MWRALIATVLAYGWGHPGLDAYRPGLLDPPLQSFYNDVNAAARDGQKALASLDGYLKGYIARMDAQLRPEDR